MFLELLFVLDSDRISGRLRYRAVNGTIVINDTYVTGFDVSGTLVINSTDNRNLSVSVKFSTLPCSNGELPTVSKTECFRCSARSYAFNASADACQPCEEHAICGGTTQLVPDDGYWHSTPFSPFIRRCPIKKACSYKNRERILAQYYNSTNIPARVDCYNTSKETVKEECPEVYEQCSKGYEGVLCGTCSKGYGHTTKGECMECSHSLPVARILIILTVVALYCVLSGKVFLGTDSVKKYIARILEDKEQAASNLLRGMASSSSKMRREKLPQRRVESTVSLSTEVRAEVEGSPEARRQDEGPSASEERKKPGRKRRDERNRGPQSNKGTRDHEPPSADLAAAAQALTTTFNVCPFVSPGVARKRVQTFCRYFIITFKLAPWRSDSTWTGKLRWRPFLP